MSSRAAPDGEGPHSCNLRLPSIERRVAMVASPFAKALRAIARSLVVCAIRDDMLSRTPEFCGDGKFVAVNNQPHVTQPNFPQRQRHEWKLPTVYFLKVGLEDTAGQS